MLIHCVMKTSLTCLTLVLAAFSFTITAEAKVAKNKPVQTYSATEPESAAPVTVTTVTVVPTAPVPQLSAPAPKAPVQKNSSYDPVPSDQVNPVVRRLRLVEEIVRKHQRAYDYRMLTTRDLESILASLESTPQTPSTAAPAAPIQDTSEEEQDASEL